MSAPLFPAPVPPSPTPSPSPAPTPAPTPVASQPPVPQGFGGYGTPDDLGQNWRIAFRDAEGVPLNMQSFEQIDFGAISYKDIFQNVKTIIATPIWSAALERTLGVDARIVDLPIDAASEATVAFLEAIYFWENRAEISDIQFAADVLEGHLIATLKLKIRNVIYGTDIPYDRANIFASPVRVAGELPAVNQPVLIPGPAGPQGPPGASGAAGVRGSLWYWGSGAPASIGGALENDMYLDVVSGDVYQYTIVGTTRTWRKSTHARRVG